MATPGLCTDRSIYAPRQSLLTADAGVSLPPSLAPFRHWPVRPSTIDLSTFDLLIYCIHLSF
jgi:hypothetical protein